MRLFVAVDIALPVRQRAAELIDGLRERLDVAGPAITWVPESRMHMTVRFIGDVPDTHVERIKRELEPPLPMAPFQVAWSGIAALPSAGHPRVLIVPAVGEDLEQLEHLVSDRLEIAGTARESRPFRPHLTLGRVKGRGASRFGPILSGMNPGSLGTDTVSAITLFRSVLSSRGPSYEPLLRTLLVVPKRKDVP